MDGQTAGRLDAGQAAGRLDEGQAAGQLDEGQAAGQLGHVALLNVGGCVNRLAGLMPVLRPMKQVRN